MTHADPAPSTALAEHTKPTRSAPRFISVFALSVGLLATDFVLRLESSNNADPTRWSKLDVGVYALGALWSALSWVVFTYVMRRTLHAKPRVRSALLVLFSIIFGAIFMSSFGYRLSFYQSPSWQVVKFAINEPLNVWRIFSWALHWGHLFALIAFSALTWLALKKATRPGGGSLRSDWKLALPVAVAYVITSAFTLLTPGFQDPLPVEANSAAAFAQYVLASTTNERHLVSPVRPHIAQQSAKDRPDVLLLVHESLRADAQFADLGYSDRLDARSLSPFTSQLPSRKAEGFYVFPKARCNATATEASVPTILSGVELGGDPDAYGRAHSVWSLGKATGASTFLYSAQSYTWSHFDEYFFDQNLDIAKSGLELGPEYINDIGVEDSLAIEAAVNRMVAVKKEGKRFVGVIHFNATHVPGYPGPGITPETDETARWMQSVPYIDQQIKNLLDQLDAHDLAKNTVIVSTADHGEPLDSPRKIRRLGSFYEETIRIPFWIRVPPALSARFPSWTEALESWQGRNVQNMNVLPTIRDLLLLDEAPNLMPPTLPGQSLVRLVDSPNITAGQSTCAFRTWSQEGLFLVNEQMKMIISNERPLPQIFDLSTDPSEQTNLWEDEQVRAKVMPWARQMILEGSERTAACKRAGSVCVLDRPDAQP